MPPEGIGQLWNVSAFGSKRTRVSGRLPDSLYQTMPSTTAMAYGWESGPLGEGHSLVAPVLGSKRPRRPCDELTYQIVPSAAMSSRRTVVSGIGSSISVSAIVAGSTLTRQLLPLQATQGTPSASILMP